MPIEKRKSTMSSAASQLRAAIVAKTDGALLGGEEDLQRELAVSRATLRQIARLLECEGLLTVKRGTNGGYFANRPDESSVETAVAAYMEVLNVRIDELMSLAAATWSEALRQAANLRTHSSMLLANNLSEIVRDVKSTLSYRELISLEIKIREDIFNSIPSPYMRFIFYVSARFAEKKFHGPSKIPDKFRIDPNSIESWRNAKLLELEAISLGDPDLGVLAALRSRHFWSRMLREIGRASATP